MPRDYYEVLGVGRQADDTEIKKSFRRLARELHPDVNSHDPQAEEKFKEAAEAYEVLSDSQRRATYDRYGFDGLKRGGYAPNFEGFGSVADIFEAFFGGGFGGAFGGGGRPAGPAQGGDVAVNAEIDLDGRGAWDQGRCRLRGRCPLRALPRQRRRAGNADRDLSAVWRKRSAARRLQDPVRPGRTGHRLRCLWRRRSRREQALRRLRRAWTPG